MLYTLLPIYVCMLVFCVRVIHVEHQKLTEKCEPVEFEP